MSDSVANKIKQRWPYLSVTIARISPELSNQVMDMELVNSAMDAMQEKLLIARNKGRGGWWSERCSTKDLKLMLKEHIDKGDMLDVMNIAAMIYYRESASIGLNNKSFKGKIHETPN